MSILIQRPGILTTVQDPGRYGFRRFGINPGGAMDPAAPRLINILLGNEEGDAVLEMHFPAPRILFEQETVAVVGGADMQPYLDGSRLQNWQVFYAKKGSVLTFPAKRLGNRTYLAVKDGFEADRWLGSSSTNLVAGRGGYQGRRAEAGDRINFNTFAAVDTSLRGTAVSPWFAPPYSSRPTVRVLPGAEFEKLTDRGRKALLENEFEISPRSDRMGFRLAGEPIEMSERVEILSSAVGFGTIQALPDNQLIVLMADHQTTGGYPRVAHVITYDLPLIGQLGAGDKVSFRMTTIEKAERLMLEFERNLNFLGVGSTFEAAPK